MIKFIKLRFFYYLCMSALYPNSALAHGSGLFMYFVGAPLAAISFLIASIIIRKAFINKQGWFYWLGVFFCFFFWIGCYFAISVTISDTGMLDRVISRSYDQERAISMCVALLPILISLAASICFSKAKK